MIDKPGKRSETLRISANRQMDSDLADAYKELDHITVTYAVERKGVRLRKHGVLSLDLEFWDGERYAKRNTQKSWLLRPYTRGRNPTDMGKLDGHLLAYVLEEFAGMREELEDHFTQQELDAFEKATVEKLGSAVGRKRSILGLYHTQVDQRDEQRRTQKHNAIHEGVWKRLREYEADAQLDLAMQVTRVLKEVDYTWSEEHIRKRVENLFDPNDNVDYRPILMPQPKGVWARFVKETFGVGVYYQLCNVEGRLDDFYIAIAENLCTRVQEGEITLEGVTNEEYERTITRCFSLEDVVDLFAHEGEIKVDIFRRFRLKTEEDPVDYSQTFTRIVEGIQTHREHYTSFKELPVFQTELSSGDSKEAFTQQLRALHGEFSRYLHENYSRIYIPASSTSFAKNRVVRARERGYNGAYRKGDLGKVKNVYSDGRIKVSVNGRSTGKILPHVFEPMCYLGDFFNMEQEFAACSQVAQKVLDDVSGNAKEASQKQEVLRQQEQIRSFHPYLADKELFFSTFCAGQMERFEDIFQKYAPTSTTQGGKEDGSR